VVGPLSRMVRATRTRVRSSTADFTTSVSRYSAAIATGTLSAAEASTPACSHRNSSPSRCCDDQMNPPSTPRSRSPNVSPLPASTPQSDRSETPMRARGDRDRPVQD
jgi:hypothetical protein